jgi:hypothetical protein
VAAARKVERNGGGAAGEQKEEKAAEGGEKDVTKTAARLLPPPSAYTLSAAQFDKLQNSHNWKTQGPNGRLLWGDKICATLISHYGSGVGHGNWVLVPRRCPHNPRMLTPRECARVTGQKGGNRPNIRLQEKFL